MDSTLDLVDEHLVEFLIPRVEEYEPLTVSRI
jgi:hypothetical protein